ncbi:PREDICTED: uncharacterized protein LOC104738748 [Camelina sativa]|uniref:Uncharacterized protein LOC104738748 n=1 Tax=Camelina sativa TaxID=90675 RepID=A0ABM0VJP0_CAMSA|nr:PREDICTED: uncharacterized protein LOC104738748 [Camelina sativa]
MKGSRARVSETAEFGYWHCLVCDRDSLGQRSFIKHLSDEHHKEKMQMFARKRATNRMLPRQSVDPDVHARRIWSSCDTTLVYWDINSCPVPPGCDASLVAPCIKRFLTEEGCSGPLSIIAIGRLTEVPNDILRKVFSSGISLHNVPYGPSDTEDLILHHSIHHSSNLMVISNSRIFGCMRDFIQSSFNLLHPFPNGSLLQSFFQSDSDSDSGELEEDNNGEYPFCEQPFSICSVCGYKTYFHWAERFTIDSAFERFTMHLDSTSHQQKLSALLPISRRLQYLSAPINEPLEKNLEAVTSVFWDPRTCPVPRGCDPRRFGLCIKRFLGNQGYSGPLTITAIGVLTDDVPLYILEGVYSGGVSLNNAFGDRAFSETLDGLITGFTLKNEPPANIMVISDGKYFTSKYAFGLELSGYNILRCDSLESIFSLPDSGALEDDECIDEMSESAFWICSICDMGKRYQGFLNFSRHVLSRPHSLQWEKWHLCSGRRRV